MVRCVGHERGLNSYGVKVDTNTLQTDETKVSQQKNLVKHVLSEEMQQYFKTVTEAILGTDFEVQQAAFKSLSGDPGLHQLLPYLSQFVYEAVKQNLTNIRVLASVLRAARCLLTNPNLHIELYVGSCRCESLH